VSRSGPLSAQAAQYQRGGGRVRVKKSERRIAPGTRQLLVIIGLVAVTLVLVREIYVFAISWSKLDVRTVQVSCPNADVRAGVERLAADMRWGNLLRVDIDRVRRHFFTYAWVKDVSVRKIFPATVRVEVTPRQPVAVLEKSVPVLVDGDGVELGPAPPESRAGLPVFTDGRGFVQDAGEKTLLGCACLGELTAEDRADVASLDLGEAGNIIATLRSNPTKIKLGEDSFALKFALYRRTKDRWTQEFGPLDYMDLRFSDRIYIRPAEAKDAASPVSGPAKEAR
jgi:cell division septal protein FtsQ